MRTDDVRMLEARMQHLDEKMAQLDQAMQTAEGRQREDFERQRHELELKRRTTGELLAQLRLEQAESWERSDVWTGLERALDKLGRFIDRVTGQQPPSRH